ncbi:MAG: transposase [Actinomycetota bacterium]
MGRPYPQEFRDDVVRVARQCDPGVTLEQIAADFGIHPMTLSTWLRKAADDGGPDRSGPSDDLAEASCAPSASGRISTPPSRSLRSPAT